MPTVTRLPVERRRHERFPQLIDVQARCLISGVGTDDLPRQFHGRIQNVSDGGACIFSSYPLKPAMFVCCSFPVSGTPTLVPALMQVRWTAKRDQKTPNNISGFQFVL